MKRIFLVYILLSFALSSCSLSPRRIQAFVYAKDPEEIFARLPVEIVADYQLAQTKDKNGFIVTSPPKPTPDGIYVGNILASQLRYIGWNDEFIVVEEQDKTQKVWRIIVVNTEYVYDCIENIEIDMCKSYDQFVLLMSQVGVPVNLELRDVVDIYKELSEDE